MCFIYNLFMKRKLLILTMLIAVLSAIAEPAKRGQLKKITLSDGTQVNAELVGDEFMHFWRAEDGKCYVQKADIFVPADIKKMQANATIKRQFRYDSRRAARTRGMGDYKLYEGKKKGLIILVQFSDRKFAGNHDVEFYQNIANKAGYKEGQFKGSVHDYFYDQSNGLFDLEFDIAGPYTLSNGYAYYGANDEESGSDSNPGKMVKEAVEFAASSFDFSQYDWDGDNEVEHVFVVYAGQGEANGGNPDTIWPHEWTLESATGTDMNVQNYRVNTYACGAELGSSEDISSGIGTICHEYTHCLGIPDMYDTSDNEVQNYGMGKWDVMCSGSYNGNGFCPAGYSSYEKSVCGWLNPIELKADTTITGMKALTDNGEAYVIYNDNHRDEFFLLECRNQTGWDASTGGKGLLILHVDFDENVWRWNAVNSFKNYYDAQYNAYENDHQRCTIVAADNTYTTKNEAGDPFPLNQNNYFGNVSNPSAKLYNANTDGSFILNKAVKDITRNNDGTVSFSFLAVDTTTEKVLEGTLFYESFDNCSGVGGNDSIWTQKTGAFKPDYTGWEYPSMSGFGANQCARFGSTAKKGSATTPYFEIGDEAELTFKAAPWDTESTNMVVNVMNSPNTTIQPANFTLTPGQWTECKATLKGAGNIKLMFAAIKNRFFIDEVRVDAVSGSTGINHLKYDSRPVDNRIYDLNGRYVGTDFNSLRKGIYISNGKKIVK